MTDRSSKAEVRNPLVLLPSAQRLAEFSPEVRAALGDLLREMSADARQRAEKSWRTHKAPMAAYWKTWAVNTRHAAVLLTRKKAA